MWSLRLGHLESYFGGPARLARRPPSPGRLVLGWPGGVLFALFFCAFSPSSVSARIVVAFAVGALAQAITLAFEVRTTAQVASENLLGVFGLRPLDSATTQTTI